jgi:GT2 family glycosyltransferase
MIDSERLDELSFDLYERYILLERIGKLFRPPGKPDTPYRVLDVGGHTPAFWPGFTSLAGELIPDASAAVVDVLPHAELRNYVRASGMQLPFRDASFDLVCSLDTLEHVPDAARETLLGELLRVTRDGLYVAFPYDSASNRWAENIITQYAEVMLKNPIPALAEHREFGLPDRERITRFLTGTSHPLVTFGQGNTDIWLLMMMTYHTLRIPGTDFALELNRRFNRVYAAQDWTAPSYRAGFLLAKQRSQADLEALKASFMSGAAGQSADLAGVLAFCQLFLNIAQNGRSLVDKDRHIRNLEKELGGDNAALRKPHQRGEAEGPEEFGGRLNELEGAIGALETHSTRMNSLNLESQGRLDERMRLLEIGMLTNKRAIQAIYGSRIWKALTGLGGTILRVTGRGAQSGVPQAAAWSAAESESSDGHEPAVDTGEWMKLVCDYPSTLTVTPVRSLVEVRGWSLAQTGINEVMVRINNHPPAPAAYGILRSDVGRDHPEIVGSDRCGFRHFWDTRDLPDGPCTVRITAVSHTGQKREAACQVVIEQKSTPNYLTWIERNEPTAEQKSRMRTDVGRLTVSPKISICVPVYKTPIPLLTRCLESVAAQLYPNWELCIADDASQNSRISTLLEERAHKDPRIRTVVLERNSGISGATNAALKLATGDYIAFLDSDDELADFALWEVARAINEHPDIDLFYSDEDKIDERGHRYDVFFKPGWDPDLFLGSNYLCHFIVLKRALLEKLGGLDVSYSSSQDYDFLLRATEHTQKIYRIPKVLYHWRAIEGSTAKAPEAKPKASNNALRALAGYVGRNIPGARVEESISCRYRVHYPIAGNPRVTILMPTGGNMNLLRAALEDVLRKTAYDNYEVLVIDNSRSNRVSEYASSLAEKRSANGTPRVRYLDWRNKVFNFSHMNNEAARHTDAPYIVFLNDDITVIAEEWLSAMLEHAQRPPVGAVGAQLWYPNNLIQHAGVVMGIYGNSGHAFKGMPSGHSLYFDLPNLVRCCTAVTAACLMISKAKFLEVGAFDEINLPVAFQDVDLCLKLVDRGYRNVYTPYALLYHHESVTKSEKTPNPMEDAYMKRRWAKYIADDPYYNPNLGRRTEDYRIDVE